MLDSSALSLDTAFASARRESPEVVQAQRAVFLADPVAAAMLEAMPAPAMVLNRQRQILTLNAVALERLGVSDPESVLGRRPGEAVLCRHSDERPAGCGTSSHCSCCGAVSAVIECIARRTRVVRECRIDTRLRALDLRVHATPVAVGGQDFVVVGLEDIQDARRRDVLERTLLQDLVGTAEEARAQVPEPGAPGATRALQRSMARIQGTLNGQRLLLLAERGELPWQPRDVDLATLVQSCITRVRDEGTGVDRDVRVECAKRCLLRTDPELLVEAIVPLLRNALEATRVGGSVSVTGEFDDDRVTLSIHNDGRIPTRVQAQIFQRSFSTRDEPGHGIGTYFSRLLVEKGLRGRVTFASDEHLGTLFLVMVPRRPADR